MRKLYNPSVWGGLIHTIIFTFFIGILSYQFLEPNQCLTACSIAFAVYSKFSDSFRLSNLTHKLNNASKLVHRDYVIDKIENLRLLLNKKNSSSLSIGKVITSIEDILTQMSRCCVSDQERDSFRTNKAIYGNFKMQIDVINNKEELPKIYKSLLRYNQTFKGILEELE